MNYGARVEVLQVFDVPTNAPEFFERPDWMEAFHAISKASDGLASDQSPLCWSLVVVPLDGASALCTYFGTRQSWLMECRDSEQFRLYCEAFAQPVGLQGK